MKIRDRVNEMRKQAEGLSTRQIAVQAGVRETAVKAVLGRNDGTPSNLSYLQKMIDICDAIDVLSGEKDGVAA